MGPRLPTGSPARSGGHLQDLLPIHGLSYGMNPVGAPWSEPSFNDLVDLDEEVSLDLDCRAVSPEAEGTAVRCHT